MNAEPAPRPESADEVCPVCRWPGQGGAVCTRCGWEGIDGFGPGSVTAVSLLQPEARLIARQRAYDLRAAARAAVAAPGDRALRGYLANEVRGGLVPGQIEEAMARVTAQEPLPVSHAGLVFALTRLVAGKTGAIAFVEISPDEMSLQILVADARGVPVPRAGESVRWDAIVPSLPGQVVQRHLRMAGGIGKPSAGLEDADPAALDAAIRDERGAFPPVLARFEAAAAKAAAIGRADHAPSGPDGTSRLPETVLVLRTRKWPLLDAAAERARAVLRPVTEITAAPDLDDLTDIVHAAAARAPLRYGYHLIVVDVEPGTGIVRPRSHELFPAGAAVAPGPRPVTTVTVSPVTDHAAEQVALPIVARRNPVADLRDIEALEREWPLVAMAALDGAAGGPVEVGVELAGPGLAKPLPSPGLLPGDALPVGWPELMVRLPDRLPAAALSRPGGLDLVILVELGAATGRADIVASRIQLARAVVREFLTVPAARIAVLGYREHTPDGAYRLSMNTVPGRERQAFVVGSIHGPRTPAETQATVGRSELWQAVQVQDDYAAPVEEPLRIIADPGWKWRSDARHVLLVIGHRPSHPEVAGPDPGEMLPCPFGHSWRDALAQLRSKQSAECFAVLDHAPKPGYAEQTWDELVASGRRWLLGEVRAPDLAQAFGLSPVSAQLSLATLADIVPPDTPEGEAAA